ncbi:MAG: transcription antitermination factor NusB [Clostridia bacterium]|nr:transcription antitermination factor NusB [Clostridia bacterium]
MSRSQARDKAFKLIFEYVFTKEIDDELMDEYLSETDGKDDASYIKDVYFGVSNKFDYLKDKIEKLSIGFSAHRIFKVDFAILLLASFELEFKNDIPFKVVINEACNLAKIYSTEKSVKFVNGILAKMVEGK